MACPSYAAGHVDGRRERRRRGAGFGPEARGRAADARGRLGRETTTHSHQHRAIVAVAPERGAATRWFDAHRRRARLVRMGCRRRRRAGQDQLAELGISSGARLGQPKCTCSRGRHLASRVGVHNRQSPVAEARSGVTPRSSADARRVCEHVLAHCCPQSHRVLDRGAVRNHHLAQALRRKPHPDARWGVHGRRGSIDCSPKRRTHGPATRQRGYVTAAPGGGRRRLARLGSRPRESAGSGGGMPPEFRLSER